MLLPYLYQQCYFNILEGKNNYCEISGMKYFKRYVTIYEINCFLCDLLAKESSSNEEPSKIQQENKKKLILSCQMKSYDNEIHKLYDD